MTNQTRKMRETLTKLFGNNNTLPPIISGAASLTLLWKIIASPEINNIRFYSSLTILLIFFISSCLLYYYLRKLEKDKDVYLISSIGKIVEDVFRHYGQMMAEKNADRADAKSMNDVMKTIVDLIGRMKNLSNKKYKD
ncbi:MAG: hypothetical protein WAV51_02455 [Microgenomates group bacterium]